jgi:hypothetical protein
MVYVCCCGAREVPTLAAESAARMGVRAVDGVCSTGILVCLIEAFGGRTVPHAGFAAVQDDNL